MNNMVAFNVSSPSDIALQIAARVKTRRLELLYVKEERKMNSIKQIEIIYDNRLVGRLALLRTTSNFLKYIQENGL